MILVMMNLMMKKMKKDKKLRELIKIVTDEYYKNQLVKEEFVFWYPNDLFIDEETLPHQAPSSEWDKQGQNMFGSVNN